METRLVIALSSVGLMLLTFVLAHFDHRLLPEQMMDYHAKKGYPAVSNGSLWGNLFLMPFVVYVIWSYSAQWTAPEIKAAAWAGLALASCAFVFGYRTGKFDDALAGAGLMHPAGVVAMLYTAGLIATFILFCFFTKAESKDVWIVGVLLLAYIPIANHLVLNLLNEHLHFSWCPQIFKEEGRPMKILIRGELIAAAVIAVKLYIPKVWR